MPSVLDYTDPYIRMYRAVPMHGPGICDICHGAPNAGFDTCYGCNLTRQQVSLPTQNVVPISLYLGNEQMHHVLRNYKDGFDTASRDRLRNIVAATFGRFLLRHSPCLAEAYGQWNVITTVPSTRDRQGQHPLEEAVCRVRFIRENWRRLLRATGVALDHQRAADDGFATLENVARQRVLLLDDTYTTGARVQSAASALQLAGADVVAAVVMGRFTDLGRPERAAMWEATGRIPFTFDVCCQECCSGR